MNYKGLNVIPKKTPVVYECGNSVLYNEKKPEDCETNAKDFLSQYEYKVVGPKTSSLGREYPMPWRQIFVKKIENICIIFEGELKGISASNSLDLYVNHYNFLLRNGLIEDVNLTKEDEKNLDLLKLKLESKFYKMRHIVDSVEYLHALQKESINIENKVKWRKMIDSFKAENKGL